MLERRAFLRSGVAASLATPFLSLPEPLRAVERVLQQSRSPDRVRLTSNENPLGMPESAREAVVEALVNGNRYPMGRAELVEAIAAKHAVQQNNVVLGNGSTEILQMIVQTQVLPGGRVVIGDPTFEHVEDYATAFRLDLAKVPLTSEHTLDLDGMRKAAESAAGPALIFVCNPNNPTGTIVPCNDVEDWIRDVPDTTWFLVDEAYFDFVDDPSYRTLTQLIDRRNVIVTRTFSKVYGLAGLRMGYGLAHPRTARRLAEYSANSNINQLGIAAARACIDDEAYIRRSLRVNRQSLGIVKKTLAELDIQMLPSHTNFFMHRLKGQVGQHISRMANAGVGVGRPFPPMLGWNRVSLGLPEEMEVWASAMRNFRERGWI